MPVFGPDATADQVRGGFPGYADDAAHHSLLPPGEGAPKGRMRGQASFSKLRLMERDPVLAAAPHPAVPATSSRGEKGGAHTPLLTARSLR